jgi:uncharacterized cofD-like protein
MEPRVVVIGGGSGASVLLRGLKRRTAAITAIVTMFDSGGSTGLLRKEFDLPALGDLRQCLVALADEQGSSDPIRSAVEFRFSRESSLNGHNVGNLMLAALTLDGDVEAAIDEMSRMLNTRGRVVPVTLQKADLCAELEDGTVVRTESAIDLRGVSNPGIKRVFLDRQAEANPRAVTAVLEADAVVLGPGDLYTSIVPNLLAHGITEAIRKTPARIIYVCNLMTKRGETDEFRASDFAAQITRYLDGRKPDWVVVNTEPISAAAQRLYAAEGAHQVEVDRTDLDRFALNVYAGALAAEETTLRHDPDILAAAVLRLAGLKDAADHGSGPPAAAPGAAATRAKPA